MRRGDRSLPVGLLGLDCRSGPGARGTVTTAPIKNILHRLRICTAFSSVDRDEHAAALDAIVIVVSILPAHAMLVEDLVQTSCGGPDGCTNTHGFRHGRRGYRACGGKGPHARDCERGHAEASAQSAAPKDAPQDAATMLLGCTVSASRRRLTLVLSDDGEAFVTNPSLAEFREGSIGFRIAVENSGHNVLAHNTLLDWACPPGPLNRR